MGKKLLVYVLYKLFIPWTEIKKLVSCFLKPERKKHFTFLIFNNEYLSSLKIIKIGPKYCVFPTKHDDICD